MNTKEIHPSYRRTHSARAVVLIFLPSGLEWQCPVHLRARSSWCVRSGTQAGLAGTIWLCRGGQGGMPAPTKSCRGKELDPSPMKREGSLVRPQPHPAKRTGCDPALQGGEAKEGMTRPQPRPTGRMGHGPAQPGPMGGRGYGLAPTQPHGEGRGHSPVPIQNSGVCGLGLQRKGV